MKQVARKTPTFPELYSCSNTSGGSWDFCWRCNSTESAIKIGNSVTNVPSSFMVC